MRTNQQTTLKTSVTLTGIGVHSGNPAEITIEKVNTKRGTGDIVTAIKPMNRVAGNPGVEAKKVA